MVIYIKEAAMNSVAETVNQLLAHYIGLAKQTAWKAYAWHRVQEMARDCPALYAELPQRLTAAMKSAQASASGNHGGARGLAGKQAQGVNA